MASPPPSCKKISMLVMTVAVLFLSTVTLTKAQNTACATKLVPCQQFLNSTGTPPNTCCGPIKDAIKNDLPCLCTIYNDPNLLSSLGINVTQAKQLSQRCGISADVSDCSKVSSPTGSPPGVPGNDGSRMAWTGFSTLLLLWAAALFS